jgi:sporulation protein YlmC with PRC-barrel domain
MVIMAEATQLTIGAEASCADGLCGEVSRVVIDPEAWIITHLVVEPKHRQGLGRLVPFDLVDISTDRVRLRCTSLEFDKLDHAEETLCMPGGGGIAGYSAGQELFLPIAYDAVPADEVTVRRGQIVHASDGNIGSVSGLVIDPRNHKVTHVLLQERNLRGRRGVAIPIGAVTEVNDGIKLNINVEQAEEL